MYLRSLELQGFKSFPDKIKLHFDKGLTAVVGPNGSGKSNIGDAVRWVLGEQSTKTLRGNKMEDVIFSGTKTRKPMGYAAVTLEISNESGELGEEYGEAVSVTRKLYRSGDSEYRINGKSVRLKDVAELFMDTGMGRDGYAIIGQGRIAEIVSAKSADRRDIFEEAAGVSKFRHKKQEAQRKLEAAQENLLRLLDIVSELENRVEPLRKQAEKAKEYVVLAESQKQLEISLWVRRLYGLREKLGAISDDALLAQAQLENTELEIRRADAQVQDGYRNMQESTLKIEELRRQMQEAEEETAQLRAAVAVGENELLHGRQHLQQLELQKQQQEQQAIEAGQQEELLSQREQKLAQQRATLDERVQQTEADWSLLQQNAAKQGKAFEETNRSLQQLYLRRSELKVLQQTAAGQQETLRAEQTQQMLQLTALQQASNQQADAFHQAKAQADAAQEKWQQVCNQRDGFQKRYANAVQMLENGKKQQEQASFALREKRQRQKLLQDMERNMEGFAGSVKAVLRADGGNPHGVFGTVAQLVKTQQRYGVAVETALGGAMQNLVVADENAAKQWIRYLAQNRAGRATFLPLTSVHGKLLAERGLEQYDGYIDLACNLVEYAPEYTDIVRFLLGRIVVAEDLDAATEIAKKCQYRFRIVTLDGQVINAGGSFTGGSAQRSGGMMTRRAELDALSSEVQRLEQVAEEAALYLQKAQRQSEQLQQKMEELHAACRTAESEHMSAAAQLEKYNYMQQQAEQRMAEAQQQQLVLQKRLEDAAAQWKDAALQRQQNDAEIQKTEILLEQESDHRESLQQKQQVLAEQRSELKIMTASLEKDAATLVQETRRQIELHQQVQESLAQLESDMELQESQLVELEQKIADDNARIQQMRSGKTDFEAQIRHWQQVHDAQDQQIRQLQNGLRETNATREKYAGELTRLEERKHSVQGDYDGVIRQLYEQYELSLTEAQGLAQPLADLQEAQRELQGLKSKIRALGTVNVAAIGEYEEVSQRYEFLSAQMKDAEVAKRELEALIESLTEEMQRIFSESFEKINAHFQQIFKDLFGGGEARLELSDPENVLESGIEIKVAPPGKVIKNLISLSGGEQSFVAIAIYFAILRLRPSPFCILDEIDAALDEGNVRRYAQYLQNFTETTQFILVTHRRSAMEEASVLYGVTMQEDGISRLLRMEQEEFSALETEA